MAVEGEFPKIDGDILFSSEANLLRPVMQVYTGTGFNSIQSGGAGTDEQSFELTAITSTQAKSAKYVKVKITGSSITGMKTNGFQIKVFSKSETNGTSVNASFTNVQTVQELA